MHRMMHGVIKMDGERFSSLYVNSGTRDPPLMLNEMKKQMGPSLFRTDKIKYIFT